LVQRSFGRAALRAPAPIPAPILIAFPENSAHEKASKHEGKHRIEPIAPLSPILGDTQAGVVLRAATDGYLARQAVLEASLRKSGMYLSKSVQSV